MVKGLAQDEVLKPIYGSDIVTLRRGISACDARQLGFDLWVKNHEGR